MRLIIITAALAVAGAASAHEIIHMDHSHAHGVDCGHQAVAHGGHIDYLHEGHLHRMHDGHADEHSIAVSADNPASEALAAKIGDHDHRHAMDKSDHPVVQHGDHFDFIHDGRLHFVHGDHVDDHGPIKLVKK